MHAQELWHERQFSYCTMTMHGFSLKAVNLSHVNCSLFLKAWFHEHIFSAKFSREIVSAKYTWVIPLNHATYFAFAVSIELTSTHRRSEIFSREIVSAKYTWVILLNHATYFAFAVSIELTSNHRRSEIFSREIVSAKYTWVILLNHATYFAFAVSIELTSTHRRSEIFSRETYCAPTAHACIHFARKFSHFAKKISPVESGLKVYQTAATPIAQNVPLLHQCGKLL